MTKKVLKKIVTIALIVSTILAIILSVLVYIYPVLTFDISVSKSIQAEGETPGRKALILFFLKGISYLGVPAVSIWMVVAVAFVFWFLKYYRESIYFLATLLAPVADAILKLIIHRPRPTGDVITVFGKEVGSSFPSGHVMFYTVFFGYLFATMFFVNKIPRKMKYLIVILSLSLIVLISISRIYLGAHWITDTIGGYLFGFIFLAVLLYFYLKKLVKIESPEDEL